MASHRASPPMKIINRSVKTVYRPVCIQVGCFADARNIRVQIRNMVGKAWRGAAACRPLPASQLWCGVPARSRTVCGSGMNSLLSVGTRAKRWAFQSSFACSIRSREEETKFQKM